LNETALAVTITDNNKKGSAAALPFLLLIIQYLAHTPFDARCLGAYKPSEKGAGNERNQTTNDRGHATAGCTRKRRERLTSAPSEALLGITTAPPKTLPRKKSDSISFTM
jgi:hypothetical protein